MNAVANTVNQHTVRQDGNVKEIHERTRQIDSLKKNFAPGVDKEKKLREACEGFESIFIQKMWEQMRATVPKSGLLQGKEEQHWQTMFDQELAKKMTSAGGIGLADMMYEQLSRNLVSASRTTASALSQQNLENGGKAFQPAPVSMHDKAAGADKSLAMRDKLGAAGLYEEAVEPEGPRAPQKPSAAGMAADGKPPAEAGAASTAPEVEKALAELRARAQNPVAGGASPLSAEAAGAQTAQAAQAAQATPIRTTFTTNIPPKVSSGRRISSPRQAKGDIAGRNPAIPSIRVLNADPNHNGAAQGMQPGAVQGMQPGAANAMQPGAVQGAQAGGMQVTSRSVSSGPGGMQLSATAVPGQSINQAMAAQSTPGAMSMAAPAAPLAPGAPAVPPAPNPAMFNTAAGNAAPLAPGAPAAQNIAAPAAPMAPIINAPAGMYEPARPEGAPEADANAAAARMAPGQQVMAQPQTPLAPSYQKTSNIRQGRRDIFKSNVSGPVVPEV